MASLIIFLSFCGFMFVAGYQFRKLEEGRVVPGGDHPRKADPIAREAIWNGMIGKI